MTLIGSPNRNLPLTIWVRVYLRSARILLPLSVMLVSSRCEAVDLFIGVSCVYSMELGTERAEDPNVVPEQKLASNNIG